MSYVGESERSAVIRLNEHIFDSIPYIKDSSPVAIHFNSKGHNKIEDLEFYIITENLIDENIRKYWESQYIHLIKNLGYNVFNDFRKKKHIFSKYINSNPSALPPLILRLKLNLKITKNPLISKT